MRARANVKIKYHSILSLCFVYNGLTQIVAFFCEASSALFAGCGNVRVAVVRPGCNKPSITNQNRDTSVESVVFFVILAFYSDHICFSMHCAYM